MEALGVSGTLKLRLGVGRIGPGRNCRRWTRHAWPKAGTMESVSKSATHGPSMRAADSSRVIAILKTKEGGVKTD